MSTHVVNLNRSIHFQLRNISRIRRYMYLDFESCHQVIRALHVVLSRMDYCNSLLFGITEFNLDKLQRLQNRAARLLLGVDRRESASPLLTQLHWLPVRQRINFKMALIIFKCLHHTAPQYFDYCIQLRVSGRPGLRSGSDGTLLSEPRSQNTSTDKAFTIAGPKLWNTIPAHIRSLDTVSLFKTYMKTYLFPTAL